MGRKNPLANIRVREKNEPHKSRNNVVTSLNIDNLPNLNITSREKNTTITIQTLKEPASIVLDFDKKVDHVKLSNREKKGKIYLPWLHIHHKLMPNDAYILLRIFVKFASEITLNSHINTSFSWLSSYLVMNKVALSDFSVKHFNFIAEEKSSSVVRGTLIYNLGTLKKIISYAPNIPNSIKERINSYKPASSVFNNSKKKLTAAERVRKYKIGADYSDYVMFQIYAYVNACLLEIKQANQRLKLLQEQKKLPELFTSKGRRAYMNFIESRSREGFENALDMELISFAKLSDAYTKIFHLQQAGYDTKKFDELLRCYKYTEARESLPVSIKNNHNITYLFEDVLPLAVGKNKSKLKYINGLGKEPEPRIHALLVKVTSNWRDRKSFSESYKDYKNYLSSNYCSYWAFYGVRTDKSQPIATTGEGFHNLLLGRTYHFDFLTLILLLCESGKNREVALSIPATISQNNFSQSVLELRAPFISEPSVWLTGHKVRGHLSGRGVQEEDIVIPVNTPLFKYLRLLDSLRRTTFPDREFLFEQGTSKSAGNYTKFLGKSFAENCSIKNAEGEPLSSIHTPKLRKVWSGEVLLKYMKDVHTKDDLVKAIAEDLRNTIPLTYLLQSSKTEGMLSSAIVGLQLKYVDHHRNLAAVLKVNNETPPSEHRHKRFLCDCSDPYNPDYEEDLNVEYCRQFDSCLGCSKATIYEEHLPNIIYRCFQYEQILASNSDLYYSYYEAKHQRALQAIQRFKDKADNGYKIHESALKKAVEVWSEPDAHLLPPLVHPRINDVGVNS